MNAKLEESAKAEFEDVVRERDVVRGLNELDRLVGEARFRKENGEGGESVPYVLWLSRVPPVLRKARLRRLDIWIC